LLVSGEVPSLDRLAVLIEQLMMIWEGNAGVPMPRTAFAAFFVNVHRQLLAQGGEPNLMRLGADGVVDHGGQPDHGAEPVGCECGRCGTKFAVGDITTAGPELDGRTGRMVVRRSVFCEFCNDLMNWTERATPAGTPSGHVVVGPFYAKEQAGRQGRIICDVDA